MSEATFTNFQDKISFVRNMRTIQSIDMRKVLCVNTGKDELNVKDLH